MQSMKMSCPGALTADVAAGGCQPPSTRCWQQDSPSCKLLASPNHSFHNPKLSLAFFTTQVKLHILSRDLVLCHSVALIFQLCCQDFLFHSVSYICYESSYSTSEGSLEDTFILLFCMALTGLLDSGAVVEHSV